MSANIASCISQVTTFLNVPSGKISVNVNSLPVRVTNNTTTTGFIAIIFDLLKQANSSLACKNLEERAELRQWLEYALVYIIGQDATVCSHHVLKELDAVLSTKTYLVSSKLSIADVVFFYIMCHIMMNLSYLEKEKYLNVSRWFDNLQQDAVLRQKNKVVDFCTNYLVVVAPLTH